MVDEVESSYRLETEHEVHGWLWLVNIREKEGGARGVHQQRERLDRRVLVFHLGDQPQTQHIGLEEHVEERGCADTEKRGGTTHRPLAHHGR